MNRLFLHIGNVAYVYMHKEHQYLLLSNNGVSFFFFATFPNILNVCKHYPYYSKRSYICCMFF